jgi:hypothetical protein
MYMERFDGIWYSGNQSVILTEGKNLRAKRLLRM